MSNPSSTIILYKDTKIIPSRNMVVDSLSDYLATLTKLTINDFQYQRHHLEMDIKIDKTQVWQEFEALNNYNYLSIQNSDSSRVVYYFIMNKTQYANSTINLHLMMDTANTFKWNTDFIPTNRTRVIREHKDRLAKSSPAKIELLLDNIDESALVILNNPYLVKIYDRVSEAELDITNELIFEGVSISIDSGNEGEITINLTDEGVAYFQTSSQYLTIIYQQTSYVPQLSREFVVLQQNYPSYNYIRKIDYFSEGFDCPLYKTELGRLTHKEDMSWNLVYHNDNNNAINCHCIPANEGLYANVRTAKTLTYTDFEDGQYYDIGAFNIDGNKQTVQLTDNDGRIWYIGEDKNNKQIHRVGSTLKIRSMGTFEVYSWFTITSLTFDVNKLYYYKTSSDAHYFPNQPNGSFDTTGGTLQELESLDDVDRVDDELLKIITIPYFPSSYEYNTSDNSITFDSTWTYSTALYKGFRLNNLNTQFSSTIESGVDNPLLNIIIRDIVPVNTELRNDIYESKLYHSDYYQPKFVYDSFGFVFAMEKLDEEHFNPSKKFTFEFVMTSTINSKFMFKFPEYVLKMSTEDYDNILPVARNNEAPIYNSPYITYLRTAYRYDLKNFYSNATAVALGMFGGMGTGLTQIIAGAFTENYGQVAQGAFTFGGSILAAIMAENRLTRNFQQKQEMMEHQKSSVSGSDDLDLLENYSGNRAKLCLYQVSSRMKDLLADLFYYTGYITDEMKIPSLTTRCWFNYIQCNLEVNTTGTNIPDELMENIKERYASGITIFHKVNGTWDLDQVKENWEVSLL